MSLADALVQVGSGWVQEMAKPQAFATVTVRYHTGGLLGRITYTETRIDQSEQRIPEEGLTYQPIAISS